MKKKELKVLTVGSSFGLDTSNHLASVALDLGYERVKICLLYIGGCSLNKHYENAVGDLPFYTYYVNSGEGWTTTEGKTVREAVAEDDWDFISIQHGTKDGSRYTLPESYNKLEPLIGFIKNIAPEKTKIVFNMAWVMATYSTHEEIRFYDGDQYLMYSKLAELTGTLVKGTRGVDIVSPAGTAVQNVRAAGFADERLMRDGFHLSYGIGRYIATLTFIKALTGVSIDNVSWMPEGVTDAERDVAVWAANAAVANPFAITQK